MSAVSELATMQRSFSADKTVKHQSRSGDDQGGGAVILDFVAHVQSAEADIIEAEEREEQQQAKREFAGLLRAYFKKLLTVEEYKFLTACIRASKSLAAAGRELGIKHAETAESILKKCKEREKDFFVLMSYSGYDCRRGCEFMARLFNPTAARRRARDKIQAVKARYREYQRIYHCRYREAHRQEITALQRERRATNKGKAAAYQREYRKRHPERARETKRKYRAAHREKYLKQQRKYNAEYLAAHREEKNAKAREKWAQRKDEINARRRERRATARAAREEAKA